MYFFDIDIDKFDFLRYNLNGGACMYDDTLFEKHTEVFGSDIGMYYCGKRVKTKNHVYGPEIRTHFLIVMVEEGTAVLYRGKAEIVFGSGDVLVMFPGENIYYKAKTEWSIKWIGVSGSGLEELFEIMGVTRQKPIFTLKTREEISNVMSQLCETKYDNSMFVKYKTQSLIYSFFSLLLAEKDEKKTTDPIESALRIIKYNYNNALNIKDMAESLFLDSAYFSRLFKSRTGMSPKKYILNLRLDRAKELLKKTDYNINEISITVGFGDPLYFSRIFCKSEGMTPTEYRKANKKD